MSSKDPGQLLEPSILDALIEIPLRYDDLESALRQVAELGREVMGSAVCSIALADDERKSFRIVAAAGIPHKKERRIRGKSFLLGKEEKGEFDLELLSRGELVEKYGLALNGQGVAKAAACARHGIHSMLATPLWSNRRLRGYLLHFSKQEEPFSDTQREQLQLLAKCAVLVIEKMERLESQYPDLDVLNSISRWLLTPTSDTSYLCDRACEVMQVPIGIIWRLDQDTQGLRVLAASREVDDQFRRIELRPDEHEGIKAHLKTRKVGYLRDVRLRNPKYDHSQEAKERGWVSLLSKPMYAGERLIGMFDVYTKTEKSFTRPERRVFDFLGNQLALYLEQAKLVHSLHQGSDSEVELDLGLKGVVKEFADIAKADYAVLRLCSHDPARLEVRAQEIRGVLEPGRRWDSPLAKGEGIAGHVWQGRASLMCSGRDSLGFDPIDPGISLLCVPIKSEPDIVGTLTLGADRPGAFNQQTLQTIEKLLEDDVPFEIAKIFSQERLERVAAMAMESESLHTFLRELGKLTRILMRAQIAIVWVLDKRQNGFSPAIVARRGQDDAGPEPGFLSTASITRFLEETEWAAPPYDHALGQYQKRLALPLRGEGGPIAILEVGGEARTFVQWRRSLLDKLRDQAAVAVRSLARQEALESLIRTLTEIAGAETRERVIHKLLDGALELVQSGTGCVSILDEQSGTLQVLYHTGEARRLKEMQTGHGVTGKALHQLHPIRLDDVTQYKPYHEYWPETVSELAVPIFLKSETVRKETRLETRRRPMGVLNVESPTPKAYSEFDEECLVTLANQAAIVLARQEYDRKLLALNLAEAELAEMVAHHREWKVIIGKVFDEITGTLGYAHVNLSLVNGKRIKTEEVGGTWLSADEIPDFKKLADHELQSDDVQADVVRKQQTIVPARNEPDFDRRFDHRIHRRFGYDRLVLVYVPMVLGGVVLGTVEAGYPRRFQKHIYERDIQILESFVDYVTVAIAQRRRELLDRLGHEFNGAIRGIRSNTHFLQRKGLHLGEDKLERKFADILTDCDVLDRQVRHLEYYLGGEPPKSKIKMTAIGPDVILKTVNQLEPELQRRGWRRSAIAFDYQQLAGVRACVDRAQTCEVMTNLFTNALKYDDPEDSFRMRIEAAEGDEFYVLKIQDWGIGIRPEFAEKIFEDGFRTPEAMQRVHGTGFGLAISRQIMRQMGGDIRLTQYHKPTEFEVLIPKQAKVEDA